MKGYIRKRGKTSWSIAVFLGRGLDGKPKYKWHTFRGSKRQAEEERARLVSQVTSGGYIEPTRMTVAEYLERWLDDYARTNVSPKTFERYAEIIHKHLVDALGRQPLAKLHPLRIQAYYSAALKTGRRDGKGGLSPLTVLHHHRVLKDALKQAVRWRLIAVSPADAVQPPRPSDREMTVLDEKQTAALLAGAETTSLYVPIMLAVTTGMRRGEILAVRWKDVDLDAGTLAVSQSLEQTKEGGLRFKQPKTKRGRRVVALPSLAVQALRSHKAQQAKLRLQLGAAYQDHDLVCAQPDGKPFAPGAVTAGFKRLIAKLKLPPVRLHDLRHTHASQLLRQGVHPKVVSERLGHATIGITLDTYSHVMPGMQEDAARRIDDALSTALANARST